VYKAEESWKKGCETCTCFNNEVTCTKTPCTNDKCPAPRKLVTKEGSCCPVCEKVECRKDQFQCDGGKCISREWLCDGEMHFPPSH
jgi:low density lipoprotein-related protein 2